MQILSVAVLLTAVGSANAALNNRHIHIARQNTAATNNVGQGALQTSATTNPQTQTTTAGGATTTTTPAAPTGTTTVVQTGITTSSTLVLTGDATLSASGLPALASISLGMPSAPTVALSVTYTPGATPPIKGAPLLPTFTFDAAAWPTQDVPPDPTSPEVQEWMQELNGFNIPDIPVTVNPPDGQSACQANPAAAANASAIGWWTCGGWTRDSDITSCPDKMTWGLSFDDGPATYTPQLLNYLNQKSLSATFFVVGSRVIQYPDTLRDEYMAGHEIAVHTWSHRSLTTQSTAQVVAELGWCRKAIQEVLGITPVYMRPPYGDIDDRVRAISLAMGMIPIIWTRTPTSGPFDTNDWQVAGGQMNSVAQYETFEAILGNASIINTGFVVLQHDLFQVEVDLATGYTIPAALTHNPPFTLKSIGTCNHFPASDMYRETTTNTTFPFPNSTASGTNTQSKTGQGNAATFYYPRLVEVGYLTALIAVLLSVF